MSSTERENSVGNEYQLLQRSPICFFETNAWITYQLISYMHHLRSRPLVNDIDYWRSVVLKFYDFSFGSTELWCFSSCKNTGQYPVYNKLAKKCGLCGSRTGKLVGGNTWSLPRLLKKKFEHGVLDEILHLNPPTIVKSLPFERVVSEYENVVRELVYHNYRVVHQGKLRVILHKNFKFASWEFCAQNFEIFRICHPHPGLSLIRNPDIQIGSNTKNRLGEESQSKLPEDMSSDSFKLAEEFGLPGGYRIASDMAETIQIMREILDFSIQHKLGPIASLQQIAAEADRGRRRDLGKRAIIID